MVTSLILMLVYSFYMMMCYVCITYDGGTCPQTADVSPSGIIYDGCARESSDPICISLTKEPMDQYRIIKLENGIYIVQWYDRYGSRKRVENPAYETLEGAEQRVKEFQLQDAGNYDGDKFEVVKTYSYPESH